MSIIDPAANHMEEVHSDCEVQALFPSTDEEPQTKGAAGTVRQKSCHQPCFQRRFMLIWSALVAEWLQGKPHGCIVTTAAGFQSVTFAACHKCHTPPFPLFPVNLFTCHYQKKSPKTNTLKIICVDTKMPLRNCE